MDGSAGPELVFDLWKSSGERKEVKADVSHDISLDVLTPDLQVKLDKDQDFHLQGSLKCLQKISSSPVSHSPSPA